MMLAKSDEKEKVSSSLNGEPFFIFLHQEFSFLFRSWDFMIDDLS
jgi:hypothetical protein